MKDTATDSTSPATGLATTTTPPTPTTGVLTTTPPINERASDYTIYKPNSRGNGGVLRFGLNSAKAALFVDAAAQSGDKQFDWDNKITMKWGLSDVGSVLATLQGRQPQAKLFHQTDKANSAFELTLRDDPERAPYAMSLSRQEASDKSLRKVSIPITHAEASVLEAALHVAVARLVGW